MGEQEKRLKILVILGILIISVVIAIASAADPAATTIQAENAIVWITPTSTFAYKSVIDFVDFATYPEKYEGRHVVFNCQVFNITSNQEFQCYLDDGESVAAVHTSKTFGDIYKGDKLTISGTGRGEQCGTNAFGAKLCYSGVEADKYDHLP